MTDAIGDCLAGRISPQVALARLLLGGVAPDAIASDVASRAPGPERDTLLALVETQRAALERLASAAAANGHAALWDPAAPPGSVAAFFDRAVEQSPEASVALYSLGDPAILAAATAEIVAWLDCSLSLWERAGVRVLRTGDAKLSQAPSPNPLPAGEGFRILDIGCGIGRMATALAPRCSSYLGIDVSAGMVAEARRRHTDLHLRFEVTDGSGLDALPPAAFDLVLAVDSFPYIVRIGDGLAQSYITGAARVLRPGGAMAILNLSYRGDPARDAADLARWAAAAGLQAGPASHPFTLWDGAAFVLQR